MIRFKIIIALTVIMLLANLTISVGEIEGEARSGEDAHARPETGLEEVIRGAVEDQSWMYSSTREEVYTRLSRYYRGPLLDHLSGEAWEFVARQTDWYGAARLKEVRLICGDGKRVVVEAVIGIEDANTGHNEDGKGLFSMLMTPGGWRVEYAAYTWN